MQDLIINVANDGSAVLGIFAGLVFWYIVISTIFGR